MSEIVRPTTIKREFRSSIRRGTGMAHLIMQEHPNIDFSDIIIDAALKNYAYDGQAEPSRASYISELILLSKQQDKIREAVFSGLAKEQEDTWSLTQLFDLTRIFAQNGDRQAKRAIYGRYFKRRIFGSDWVGTSEIILLDGLDGLKRIAKIIGKHLMRHPDYWEDDSLINQFKEECPDIDPWKELEISGLDDKYIMQYLAKVKEHIEIHSNKEQEALQYHDIIEEIKSRPMKGIWLRNRKLSEFEISQIAEAFLAAKDIGLKEKFLRAFNYVSYPFDPIPILLIAKSKPNSKNRLTEFAIDALKNIKHDEVRRFAIDRLQNTNDPAKYADILVSNYDERDELLLHKIVERYNNEDIIHSLTQSYITIYEANSTPKCSAPLIMLYNKSNCGLCRTSIVKLLLENNVLPATIRKEGEFDCNQDTRLLLYSSDDNATYSD